MCSLEIRKLTSCVGYAMRTASRLQMSEVKEHLVIALTLLRSDKCGQNVEDIKTGSKPLLSPVVVAPTVPLQNSEAKAFANDFPATILHAVELSCNGMINKLVEDLNDQVRQLADHSAAVDERCSRVERVLVDQHEKCRHLARNLESNESARLQSLESQVAVLRSLAASRLHVQGSSSTTCVTRRARGPGDDPLPCSADKWLPQSKD